LAADPYSTLGVNKDATQADIQKAYRRLAKKLHPDLNTGDKTAEDKFKDVSVAYDLLNDPDKRARFDRGEIDASGTSGHASNITRILRIRAAGRLTPATPAFPISVNTPEPRIFSRKFSVAPAVPAAAGAARMFIITSTFRFWMPSTAASNLLSFLTAPR
jgi:curved DNA-binding protein CbpA